VLVVTPVLYVTAETIKERVKYYFIACWSDKKCIPQSAYAST